MATAAPNGTDMLAIQQKYAEEAAKRLRADGLAQFVELKDSESDRFRQLGKDPWVDHDALNSREPAVKDGGKYKFVVLGAGFGGLLFAARLIQSGAASGPEDIRIVDAAGGFGGTWYWNRYPGLHCDVESYTYLPLLEETGYMPKSKYASGPEILEYANLVADHWNLRDKTLFRTTVTNTTWDDAGNLWTTKATEDRGPGQAAVNLQFQSQYVLIASGILTNPQIPKIPGLDTFSGSITHAARWDYSLTGGSPTDMDMPGLAGKRVGLLGTGATAIQAVPKLAKSAKELYVFQRTPSAIHWRGQRATDPEEWKAKMGTRKGWQHERRLNFNSYVENAPKPDQENLVGDAWTSMPAYSAVIGGPTGGIVEPAMDKITEHVGKMHMLDISRAEGSRAKVDEVVKDKEVAEKLKAWYPVWCKRPTFSDEYLETFNLPNVHLVDTDGKGISSATQTGLVVDGKEYPLDVLILATGYRTPAIGNGSPAVRTGIEVFGRGGKSLDEKWQGHGAATLHGMCTNGYPNLFFAGTAQGGAATNFAFVLDVHAVQVAHIIAEAEKRQGAADGGSGTVIEVTTTAEEAWSMECMRRAAWFSSIAGCTPGYITSEGQAMKQDDPVAMQRLGRAVPWCDGMTSFVNVLEAWREKGGLEGLKVGTA